MDIINSLVVSGGNVYVAGYTNSSPFPGTTGGSQPAFGGGTDGFVSRLSIDLKAVSPAFVTTDSATNVTFNSATLNGTVNAYNASTVVTFQYGLTTSYGTTVTATESPVTGFTDTAVSAGITGLIPGTTYHFCVVAQNPVGTTNGGDMTFTVVTSGTVVVNPDPDSINAPWTLTGPYSYSQSGTGDQTLNNLPAGDYTIAWGNVSGWTKPGGETKAVTSGETTIFSGTYSQSGGFYVIPNKKGGSAVIYLE